MVYQNNGNAYLCSRIQRETAMFLFHRSGIAVLLALVVAGLPVLIQLV